MRWMQVKETDAACPGRRVNRINEAVNGKMIRYGRRKPRVPDHLIILYKSFHEIRGVEQ